MSTRLENCANEAIKSLSQTWREGDAQNVSLPVQYPSGALTVVQVTLGRTQAHLSDMGAGLWEAEQLCPDTGYAKHAEREAAKRGLRFDGHAVLALEIPISAMAAGLIAVANASAQAASAAVLADSEKRTANRRDEIFERVRFAFPAAHVSKELELPGERATWQAHNVVSLKDNRKAVFEPVSNHTQSISSKFLMLSDLAKRPELILNAVFPNRSTIDPKGQMLREVAAILGETDEIERYQAAAIA